MKQQPQSISTKFGNARVYKDGHYVITSGKEGNNKKLLHRLIYQDYYGVTLLPGIVVHHLDNNPLNNDPKNLRAMTRSEHNSIHKKGKNHPNYGKKGKESFAWKDYPTIVKNGTGANNKQNYMLKKNSKVLKQSINLKDLIDYGKELGFDRIQVLGEMKQLD